MKEASDAQTSPENELSMSISQQSPGGILNKVLYGEALPRGPTPYPCMYHFLDSEYIPFAYLPLPSGTPFPPFHIPSFDRVESLLTAVNALVLNMNE